MPKLEIGVNDYFDQTEVDADLGSDNDYLYSIGGNLNGNENAAFNMAALSIYNIALSDVQIKAVANALAEEFRKKNG